MSICPYVQLGRQHSNRQTRRTAKHQLQCIAMQIECAVLMSFLWVLYLILQLSILNKSVPEFACWEVCFVNKSGPDIYVNGRETESNQKRCRCRGWWGGGQVGTSSPNFESNLWSRSQLYTQFPLQSDTFLRGYWEGRDLWMILMGHFQMGSEPRAQKEGREPAPAPKKKNILMEAATKFLIS